MTAPTTLRYVIAHTTHDGPVVLRSCETVQEQRRAYRDALATLRDGGFDGDVVGIELDSGEPVTQPAPRPIDPQTFRQEALQL